MAGDFLRHNNLYYITDHVEDVDLGHSFLLDRMVVVFCFGGSIRLKLEDVEYELKGNTMLIALPRTMFTPLAISKNVRISIIGFNMPLQDSTLQLLSPLFFEAIHRMPVWRMDGKQADAATGFCQMFRYICNDLKSSQKGDMAVGAFSLLLQALQANVEYVYREQNQEKSISSKNIMYRFIKLLHRDYRKNHHVAYYADQLCVSSKYLTQVVKKSLNLTPKDLIDKRLASESVYLLSQTTLTIQEISNELGFPDQSYFGRFFRRMFDISPAAFRESPSLDLMGRLR